jgi:hypothetical protein
LEIFLKIKSQRELETVEALIPFNKVPRSSPDEVLSTKIWDARALVVKGLTSIPAAVVNGV